jgi:hypothetical protein
VVIESHIEESYLNRVRKYLGYLQVETRLTDYEVDIKPEPCDDDAAADIRVMDTRRIARLRLCKGWEQVEADEQRHVLVHELMHIYLWKIELAACDCEDSMTKKAFGVYYAAFDRAIESAADALAEVIAPKLMTMPEWESAQSRT